MCGICGTAATDPREVPLDPGALLAMTGAIEHRGPDDDGHVHEPGVAMGMRRLSIIDLDTGSQPLHNEDGTVSVVFNGEIYNYRELRRELRGRGHTLRTEGDGETIVHLYEEHGLRFVEHLRGMFAIALWDRRRRRLVLARDRMGVKPLYLASGPAGLSFASEVKCLMAAGVLEPALDPDSAELFMAWGFVPGPRTLFAGVRKLPPATVLSFEDGRIAEERTYWTPWDAGPTRAPGSSWEDDQRELLDLLRTSVRARMVADVPLGVMLSGGLDSSLIAALMAEASPDPIKTFSIGFEEDAGSNELPDAARVAARLGTDHHALMTSAGDHPGLLDEALWHLEEPIADLSYLGFMLLSRLAAKHVKVALSGQGADELLGGYRKHQIAAYAGGVGRVPLLGGAMAAAGRRMDASSSLGRGLIALGTEDHAERLLAMSRVVQAPDRARTFTPDFLRPGAEAAIREVVSGRTDPRARSVLAQTLNLDTRIALVDNMLLYFDKASMAASLEVRVPFMDHDVVSFCAQLPDSRLVWGNRRKALLKRASQGLVDDAIIDKRKRGFFHSALGAWLRVHRDDLVHETLMDRRTLERGQYQPHTVRELVANAGTAGKKPDQRLFSLFLLERWQRLFVDADAPARQPAAAAPDAAPISG